MGLIINDFCCLIVNVCILPWHIIYRFHIAISVGYMTLNNHERGISYHGPPYHRYVSLDIQIGRTHVKAILDNFRNESMYQTHFEYARSIYIILKINHNMSSNIVTLVSLNCANLSSAQE